MCAKVGNIGSHLQPIGRSSVANTSHLRGKNEDRQPGPAPRWGLTCSVPADAHGHPSGAARHPGGHANRDYSADQSGSYARVSPTTFTFPLPGEAWP
ncbi:gamma-aminobutyraldehyde dehydrogenase [Streptomyces lydicamycinicus]|uniref:Gamma-aminobutyraldehyde dehydrogenase n=1 Tax=Streptomyces lydicamycinicus TaxID=1546107 RepID=A0A0P4R4H0_9ACTN|nr:gamma-aminobutyraldehyde dehydrogenase [Streptomyces lydicamycinicus]